MSCNESEIVLICGFHVEENEIINIPMNTYIEKFRLPYYGVEEKCYYVGIVFGKISNIFNFLCSGSPNKPFQITGLEPTEDIINEMKEAFPEKTIEPFAFLRSWKSSHAIYTSHYYGGFIGCGYFVEDKSDKPDKYMIEFSKERNDIDIYGISHTLNVPIDYCFYFAGKELSPSFTNFEENDFTGDPGRHFYKMLTSVYECNDNFSLKASDFYGDVQLSNKMIAFIPIMCYCCT